MSFDGEGNDVSSKGGIRSMDRIEERGEGQPDKGLKGRPGEEVGRKVFRFDGLGLTSKWVGVLSKG